MFIFPIAMPEFGKYLFDGQSALGNQMMRICGMSYINSNITSKLFLRKVIFQLELMKKLEN